MTERTGGPECTSRLQGVHTLGEIKWMETFPKTFRKRNKWHFPCRTAQKPHTQTSYSPPCPSFLLTNISFKYYPFLIWIFRQFFLVLSLFTSWKSPLDSSWWVKLWITRNIFATLGASGESLECRWLRNRASPLCLERGLMERIKPWISHPKVQLWNTSALISLPVLEPGSDCPAGLAGQGVGTAPPALPPSGDSTGPWSGPCRAHSLSLLVLMLPLKPFFPAGK